MKPCETLPNGLHRSALHYEQVLVPVPLIPAVKKFIQDLKEGGRLSAVVAIFDPEQDAWSSLCVTASDGEQLKILAGEAARCVTEALLK